MPVLFAILVLLGSVGRNRGVPAQTADPWSRVGWLAGCWELRAGPRVVREQWMPPGGGMMLGSSRTVVRDTVREWEQLRIEERAGRLAYVAHPSGQPEAAFALETATADSVVFANPAHDFPQRIGYRRIGADSLVARIEGTRGGRTRGIDFPMARVGCAGPPNAPTGS